MATIELLIAWTPFLAEGFLMNLLVGGCGVLIGTSIAAAIVITRSALPITRRSLDFVSTLLRNIPTLVFLFYAASLLPKEIALFGGVVVPLPQWLKASLALAASPVGLTVWNLEASVSAWLAGRHREAMLFFPNWLGGLLIAIMASSLSSLVGVSELVGRCNTLINATGTDHMLAIYAYASLFFIASAVILTAIVSRLRAAVSRNL